MREYTLCTALLPCYRNSLIACSYNSYEIFWNHHQKIPINTGYSVIITNGINAKGEDKVQINTQIHTKILTN